MLAFHTFFFTGWTKVKTKHWFSINVWAGVIGTTCFSGTLKCRNVSQFSSKWLVKISTKAKLDLNKGKTNFTNDFAPHHTTLVKSELNTNYWNWIGGGGAVAWFARSPDLNSMDYFMWDFLKKRSLCNPSTK